MHVLVPGTEPSSWFRFALKILLAGLLISAPVLALNGFPLTFDDTPGYLEPAYNILHRAVPPAWMPPADLASDPASHGPASPNIFFLRPFGYMVLLVPFASALGLWLIPLAQGVLAALIIHAALVTARAPRHWALFFGIVAVLALTTSLPLHVATIMPDVFTGLVILLVYVNVFQWRALPIPARLIGVATLTALATIHLSHLAILAGMVAALGLWSAWKDRGRLLPIAGGVLLPLVLAVGLLMTSNLLTAGRPVVSESSPVFLLARLIGDGPARDYLKDACPTHAYLLCDRLDTLDRSAPGYPTSDYFLWHPDGARRHFGDTPRFVEEAAEIAHQTIATRPLEVVSHGLYNTAAQLFHVQLDDTLTDPVKPLTRRLFSRFPSGDYDAFDRSLQTRQAFPRDVLDLVQDIALAVAIAALLTGAVRRRGRIDERVKALLSVIGLGLMLNAAVTGGLSAVHDRYQNRVIWLIPFAAMVVLATARSRDASAAGRRRYGSGWNLPPQVGAGTPVVEGTLNGSPSRLRTAR
ncbi:hypothetical protein [Azospirillum sp. TSO35-2]|uniref:hypothetical protein n=1 Tax=Azospirillum sp. TSO35-2 TaxID=716796 RepID=UPI001304A744|nr:hypothetical protein [Azospirillum sp. TSO35-2]